MAFLALIDDMALRQGILSHPVKATWAILTDNPADGTLVEGICWRALEGGVVSPQICGRVTPHIPPTPPPYKVQNTATHA